MLSSKEVPIYEDEHGAEIPDPDEVPIADRNLVTQPYDLVVSALIDQIKNGTLHLRPLSSRPRFQRRYVWSDSLASRLIESMLLNVPIPACYMSQNDDYELDVIDGQQRIYSIYRYIENQFKLTSLEVLKDLNGKRFFELPEKDKRRVTTFTLRCIIITNASHPEIRFDVFERLNTNTVPLNAQELRNSIYRGALIDLLSASTEYGPWLDILGRKEPDKRMRDEELILRFFAFHELGLASYKTPQKHWLNDYAKAGRKFTAEQIDQLGQLWKNTIDKCLVVFEAKECFRRLPLSNKRSVINRALMDLTMQSIANLHLNDVQRIRQRFYDRYVAVLADEEFSDLITRAIDHKTRTQRRFEIWDEKVIKGLE